MKKNLALLFIALTYILTWSVEIPAALAKHGQVSIHIPKALQMICTLSPGIVALLLTMFFFKKRGMRFLTKGIVKWRVKFRWYLFLIISSLVFCGLSLFFYNLICAQHVRPDQFYNFLFYFLLILPLSALWEEIGWRGFLLPILQKNHTPLQASLIIGLVWGLWHLPIYLAIDPYGEKTLLYFDVMFIGCFAISILQTWFYNATNGSLLICILFHNSINTSAAYFYGNLKGAEFRPLVIFVLLLSAAAIMLLIKTRGMLPMDRRSVAVAELEVPKGNA